jgi:primosomal protein N' (replication factor Y)
VLRLARAVADRYAGTLSDVLRLAVPPRHAGAERIEVAASGDGPDWDGSPGPWSRYPAGPAFVARLAAGGSPRAVWTALPGRDWAGALAVAAAATLASGRGALLVLPDRRDVDAVEAAVLALLGPGRHARLEAELGAAPRYAAFLALRRGRLRLAVGTRAAAFAPVADLGLAVIWDDGDDQHAEPRAPYPHAREVLALRAGQAGAAFLAGGWSRTAEAQQLLADGFARPIAVERAARRDAWPRIVVSGSGPAAEHDPHAAVARMPSDAWRVLHDGLARGPVLIQVPRKGYVPVLACRSCRHSARCPHCAGPLELPGKAGEVALPPQCGWCGRAQPAWRCPACGSRGLRAVAIGVERTAEELGRSFPGARVVLSRPVRKLPKVPPRKAVVLATPGIEPVPEDGYAAAVLLDGDVLLSRPDLRAGEEALRRWLAAAALVRPAGDGGVVMVCADPSAPAVQALVRADPASFADRELAERAQLRLPPAVAAATVTGAPAAARALLDAAVLPDGVEVLGPVELDGPAPGFTTPPPEGLVRYVLRAGRDSAEALAAALRAAAGVRSARRDPGLARVRIAPRDLG